ncbi:GNAT family N-acetyltransferase [Azospirillum halopraeferens]|uniref:GNAT family N-acetyltransferase n=1 Tax=Azospirillum halopraeferens TaxID=34010 RepID=UPI00048EA50A|nr:GNAT family N-acetyltransferase [Azospirillum halopraeferens]
MSVVAWAQRGIGRFEPDDGPALAAFHREFFGADSIQADPAYFRWIYREVPHPDPEGLQLWLCKRNGAIVGQQSGIPFRLKTGDRTVAASWGIDLMVAPEWRLRGVGPALTETHANTGAVTVSLGMTDPAYKSYIRSGWCDLGSMPTFVRVIDPAASLRAAGRGGTAVRLAAGAARPVLTAAAMAMAAAASLRGARPVEVDGFDGRSDALWEAAAPQYPVLARRDRAFLNWRFDRCPAAARFRRFYVMRRGEPMAYAVVRLDRWKGATVAVVVDYLARPGWLRPTFALLVDQARHDGAAALLCRTMNRDAAGALTPLGFLCLKNGLNKATRVVARPGPGYEELKPLLADPRNWFLTTADSDIGFRELADG